MGLALIIAAAATVVLIAVGASGAGPVMSLRRTIKGFDELREAADGLRRSLEVMQQRTEALERSRRELGGGRGEDAHVD